MTSSVLNTKLYVPQPRPVMVSRRRLIDRLDHGLWWQNGFARKLTLVSAPAGFGKTTLLSEWVVESERPTAWVSLDEEDNGPTRFLAYLIAALRTVRPDIGEGLISALHSPHPPSTESVLWALINAIGAPPSPSSSPVERGVILVLDDYHVIEANGVHAVLDYLLHHLPALMHVVIATRIDPPLPLARLRAQGQLLELRQADLRFTRQEAGEFLNRVTGLTLSPDEIDALTARTEGWIAGLQMAALSMRGQDDLEGFVRAFTGSHRFIIDYLAEEVLSRQQEDVQTFLVHTAILDRMSASLCNALTGREESQVLLEMLDRDNLFVVPLDDERRWYRYHRLFRDVLQQRLLRTHPKLVPSLHARASAWFDEHGFVTAAVDHALHARNVERATRLIETNANALWGRGEQAALLRWLDALPDKKIRAHPRLSIYYAMVLFTAGRNDEAASQLEAARETLDTTTAGDQTPLQGILDAARAFITFSQGDLPTIVHLSRRALARLPNEDQQWRSIAAYTLGLAQRLGGDLESAGQAFDEAVTLSSATGNHYVALIARLNLARLQTQRGHLRRAAEILHRAIHLAEATGMSQLPVAGLLSAELGSILIEWNDLAEALRLLESGTKLIARGEDVIATAMSYGFMVRALFARGDLDRAQEEIGAMARLAEEAEVGPWISHWIVGLRLQMFLAQGDPASAARLAERVELDLDEEPAYPREMAYAPLVQLYIAQGRPQATLKLLGRLVRAAQEGGRIGRVIATLALRACALEVQGDVDAAMVDLARALSLAEPEGYVRVFVEQGPVMATLLRRAATRGIAPKYASRLLTEFDVSSRDEERREQPLIEPLTERELEVLYFLASDLTMEEIGQQLFVARSTIHSHAKSIYGKLNVHSRREAVRRARALGLFRAQSL